MIIPIEKDHLLSKNYEFQACVVSDGEREKLKQDESIFIRRTCGLTFAQIVRNL